MRDERLSYEPWSEDGEHFILATATLKGRTVVKAHGKTHREAMEELASALADLSEVMIAAAKADSARATVRKIVNHPMSTPNHVHEEANEGGDA